MPDPVNNAISYRDVYSYDCARPQGLLAGVLCSDSTAVSDACRTAVPGTTAAYVCDDRNLQGVQQAIQTTTWDILKNVIATALFGGVRK